MSIDLSQFTQVFFEESFEGIDTMESHLLELDAEDTESLNAAFRAAHSIKGGAGMFDFTTIVDFTHIVETLLDEMRSGKRDCSDELVTLLLESSDSIKTLLQLAQDQDNSLPESVSIVQQQLQAALDGKTEATTTEPTATELTTDECTSDELIAKQSTSETSAQDSEQTPNQTPEVSDEITRGWEIRFSPHPDMLKTGNEPSHMIAALHDLGELDLQCHLEKLPTYKDIDPEICYLSWTIRLFSDVDKDEIEEIFAWVEDDCDLGISALSDSDKHPASLERPLDPLAQPHVHSSAKTPDAESSEHGSLNPSPVNSEAETITERRSDDRRDRDDRRGTMDRRTGGETNSIRVNIDKIDTLINRVGELVITQSMLAQLGSELEDFSTEKLQRLQLGLAQLERNTREIQEDVMQIRMLPISFVFNRFPRMARDLQTKLNKKLELVISGETTELDKTLMEKISDPLVHLVRNSIDHGIELPEQRRLAGKDESGRVELNAFHQGGNIIIEIKDDGQGLNSEKIIAKARENGLLETDDTPEQQQVFDLIMQPGFSTVETVSDLSGRGVGMDVVSKNINELGGNIEISSEQGQGSCFRISLPLTLAIIDGQQVSIDDQIYIIPLVSIIESIQIPQQRINAIAGKDPLYSFRGNYIPLISLRKVMGLEANSTQESLIVVVEANAQHYGLIVDDLLGQQQFVIKSLEENYRKVEGVSGATILGNGRVGLILDVVGVLRLYRQLNRPQSARHSENNVIRLNAG